MPTLKVSLEKLPCGFGSLAQGCCPSTLLQSELTYTLCVMRQKLRRNITHAITSVSMPLLACCTTAHPVQLGPRCGYSLAVSIVRRGRRALNGSVLLLVMAYLSLKCQTVL